MSFIDHDDIDRLRAQSQAIVDHSPRVTRRRDGKVFRIVSQARSPDGPVELAAITGHPIERVTINGLAFTHEFIDSRKPAQTTEQTMSIPTPQEIRAKREIVRDVLVDALVAKIVRQFSDDSAETVTERAPVDVAQGAADALRRHGWPCEVSRCGPRDADGQITVSLCEVES